MTYLQPHLFVVHPIRCKLQQNTIKRYLPFSNILADYFVTRHNLSESSKNPV